LVMQGKC